MNCKIIPINGDFNYEDQYRIEFSFFGTSSQEKNILKKKIEQKIKKVFESKKEHPTIIEATTYLKTILRELEEISLTIYLIKELDVYRLVQYNNGKLNIYQYNKVKSSNNLIDIKLEYNEKTGMNLSVQSNEKEIPDNNLISKVSEEFCAETSILSSLQKITSKKLTEKEQELYEIYRLFFKENPDFSDEVTQEKTQYMLSCLNIFKINIDANIFWLFPQLIENLSLFGKMSEEFNTQTLTPKIKKEIQVIGKEIRTYLENPNSPIDTLREFIKIETVKTSSNLSIDILDELLQNEKIFEKKLDSHTLLIRKISSKL